MTTTFAIITIAILYGTYDLFIKLGAGRIDPALGAMFTQIASALTLVGIFIFQYFKPGAPRPQTTIQGVLFVSLAGVLIATALIYLFFVLQNKETKVATAIPIILILRNVTLVSLGILVLGEKLSFTQSFGIGLSLIGIYLISL